jgi:hypothetical protein
VAFAQKDGVSFGIFVKYKKGKKLYISTIYYLLVEILFLKKGKRILMKNAYVGFSDTEKYKEVKILLVKYDLIWKDFGDVVSKDIDKLEEMFKNHKK